MSTPGGRSHRVTVAELPRRRPSLAVRSDRPACIPTTTSPLDVLVALLLLFGGVELNPGPMTSARSTPRDTLPLGVLNVRSARCKAALTHDVIDDHRLDALALTEIWIPSDAPDAVKLDACPPGYQVLHRHRGTSDQLGGGVALVYRDTIKATMVDVGNYTEFESLAIKLTGLRSKALVVVCVFRPPGTVTGLR